MAALLDRSGAVSIWVSPIGEKQFSGDVNRSLKYT